MDRSELTQNWIRNEADCRAVANGCWFDLDRATYAVWWIERFCRLYEGERAGEPLVLFGAFSEANEPILDDWDEGGRELSYERAYRYMACVAAGERVGWQYEVVMRLFGWVRHSERWNREVRRFRKGAVWIPKKSGKSPTLAAVGLYLLAGDGEMGQKVFLAAKDGTQARDIAGQHALEMVRSSPELSAECTVNLSRMRITHERTRSFMQPLSSGDSRTQESKEGINGSVLVDETHVVDRDFITRITRAGISRSEPLFLQFSTAGKNPDGYGKEEYDYGVENNNTGHDDSYFCACYGADQKLTDNELAADPEGIIARANPAMGHTIDLAEAVADYHASKVTISRLADFKTYRLNVWQRSANPWLRGEDWSACRREFTADDLLSRPCGAGLDLGNTDDMSCLALVFPENWDDWAEAAAEIKAKEAAREPGASQEEDKEEAQRLMQRLEQPVKTLAWYWLPEEAVEKYKKDVPQYQEWAASGYLRLTTGRTLQPDEILADLTEIFKRYNVLMFAHDPWHAALILRALQQVEGFPEDYCLPFKQTIQNFAFPTALMERLVIGQKLWHNGHPITDWQAGHVQVKEDNNGNMRPVKPPRQSRKKIDGIVAHIMALDAATRMAAAPATGSIYDHLDHIMFF